MVTVRPGNQGAVEQVAGEGVGLPNFDEVFEGWLLRPQLRGKLKDVFGGGFEGGTQKPQQGKQH